MVESRMRIAREGALVLMFLSGCASEQADFITPVAVVAEQQKPQDVSSVPTRLTGSYRYLADAALFQPCGSEQRLPVFSRADSPKLERAYLAKIEEAGAPLLVDVVASVHPRLGEEGATAGWQIDEFVGLSELKSCEEQLAEPPLTHTYWKLLSIDGQSIQTAADAREIHIVFGADSRAHGFAGCNRFFAHYEWDEQQLSISNVAGTKKACPQGINGENHFLSTLQQVDRYKITGQQMYLFNANDQLMTFVAVYLR
jgi:heat shock protein HslJ